MAFLFAIRDALIVLALSWVGVTLEPRASEAGERGACNANICIDAD
ncbi:MAG: hypothetical protein AB7P07_05200 [Hyphomonadaceae bacterium]